MNLESILNLHNDLTRLDPNVPIVVTCKNGQITYRQLNAIVTLNWISCLYFSPKDIKLGLLTPDDFKVLMDNLEQLLQDPKLLNGSLETVIKNYGFDIYKLYATETLYGPQIYLRFKLVTFRNSFITRWILRRFSPETETLLKMIKNEKRISKSRKQR